MVAEHLYESRRDQPLRSSDNRRSRGGEAFLHRRRSAGQRDEPGEQRTSADATCGGVVSAHL